MRPLRRSLPAGLYELSVRITGNHMLLAPGKALNDLVLGVIGRCQHGEDGKGVKLHAFAVLSNHYHMLISVESSEALSNFQRFVNGKIALKINMLLGRSGVIWERRFRSILVVGDRYTQLWRLRYIMAHGVKEGLVARMGDWPGATSNDWLRFGKKLTGVWTDHTALGDARRRKSFVEIPGQFDTIYELEMTPLPCFANTPAHRWRRQIERLVAEIHAEADQVMAQTKRTPLGVEAILATDPFARVIGGKHGRAPTVLAKDETIRTATIELLRELEERWRAAAAVAAALLSGGAIRPGRKLPAHLWTRVTL